MSNALLSKWGARLVQHPAGKQQKALAVLGKPLSRQAWPKCVLGHLAGPFQKSHIIRWAKLLWRHIDQCLQRWNCRHSHIPIPPDKLVQTGDRSPRMLCCFSIPPHHQRRESKLMKPPEERNSASSLTSTCLSPDLESCCGNPLFYVTAVLYKEHISSCAVITVL